LGFAAAHSAAGGGGDISAPTLEQAAGVLA
jgi:hypothetical protein